MEIGGSPSTQPVVHSLTSWICTTLNRWNISISSPGGDAPESRPHMRVRQIYNTLTLLGLTHLGVVVQAYSPCSLMLTFKSGNSRQLSTSLRFICMHERMYVYIFFVYLLSLLFQLFFFILIIFIYFVLCLPILPHCWWLSGSGSVYGFLLLCCEIVETLKTKTKKTFGHTKRNTQHDGSAVPELNSNIWPSTILTCTDINYQAWHEL